MSVVAGVLGAEPIVRWDWVGDHLDDVREKTVEHLQLTGTAVLMGFALSMTMAVIVLRWRSTYAPLAAFCGFLYTIPSLALFAFLVPITGLGFVTGEIGLVSYTLFILLRNIVAGVDGVPPAIKEAADGMGYRPWQRFVAVDLRLATPAIVAGVRIATVTVIGLVTITALVGNGGYGSFINDGLGRNFPTPIVLGTALSVAMAVAFDLVLVGIERAVTPWTRRGAAP